MPHEQARLVAQRADMEMRVGTWLAAALVAATVVSASAAPQAPLTDAEIGAALAAGGAKKASQYSASCVAKAAWGQRATSSESIRQLGPITVTFSGNLGRIAQFAQRAKRLYQQYGPADVTSDLRTEPRIFVLTEPAEPYQTAGAVVIAPVLERAVLRSARDQARVLQPVSLDLVPVEWQTPFGGRHKANRAVATFSHSEFMALPDGDIEAVLITNAGERSCKVGMKDQRRVFGR